MVYEVDGTYGGSQTPCVVFVSEDSGAYCVEGGTMVNFTNEVEKLVDGVDIEELSDIDCFTVNDGIDSLDEFRDHVEEFLEG